MNITRQFQHPAHQRQPQHHQQHAALSHLSTDWHWASVWNKCSGASPGSLIQEMANWTLGCMTHLKVEGKIVKTCDPGTLVPRLGDLQEGQDERKLNCIHCWGAHRCLQAPERKFLSHCPSSLVLISSADLPPCSSRKQYSRLSLLCSRHSGEIPAIVTPRVSRVVGDWLIPNLKSKEHLLLIHTTYTFRYLGNMNLNSEREAFSSQPSGNLDKCLMFPQGTPGWGKVGFEISLDEGDVFPLCCSKRLGASKALSMLESHLCFSGT